jgi:hypothetical protein
LDPLCGRQVRGTVRVHTRYFRGLML